jgi:hypothetical protein
VTAIHKLEKAKRRVARADAQGDHSGRVATAGTKNHPTHCRAGDRSPSRKSLERYEKLEREYYRLVNFVNALAEQVSQLRR